MYMYIPVITIVCSNVVYQLCAKSTSPKINPFASLALTYAIGIAVTIVAYYVTSPEKKLLAEFQHMNWATVVLGVAIVALEAGNIFMYKLGWDMSRGPLTCSISLAIVLVFVGYLLFKEAITLTKVVGIITCLVGLFLVNRPA